MLIDTITQYITQLQKEGLYRQRENTLPDGMICFNSNDYLSLASDPRIKKAYQTGFQRYPVGSGGSMVVCGYHPVHKALEHAFAEALAVDECVVFSSGYAANLSLIALLSHLKIHVLIDKGIHASIYDGLNLSSTHYARYFHNDLIDFTLKLNATMADTVVITEGVFSMSGQAAPLAEMAQISMQKNCPLLVDEAHAFGVMGQQGLGAVLQQQLTQKEVPLRVIPLGKAYAASGAIIAGQKRWIDALLQCARANTYSTALSPAFAWGLLETLEIITAADARREKLQALIDYFREKALLTPFTWSNSCSAIQQLQLGCPHLALFYAEKLREFSLVCTPMRQPTVSKKHTGLRVILNYHHQPEHIDHLFGSLLKIHAVTNEY